MIIALRYDLRENLASRLTCLVCGVGSGYTRTHTPAHTRHLGDSWRRIGRHFPLLVDAGRTCVQIHSVTFSLLLKIDILLIRRTAVARNYQIYIQRHAHVRDQGGNYKVNWIPLHNAFSVVTTVGKQVTIIFAMYSITITANSATSDWRNEGAYTTGPYGHSCPQANVTWHIYNAQIHVRPVNLLS
jgi:hypothetical protein